MKSPRAAPLMVTAYVPGPIALARPVMLDALLAAAVCVRDGAPPVVDGRTQEVDVPIALDPSGRIRLTSASVYELEAPQKRFLNQRTDIFQATHLGEEKFKRVQLSTGRNKSYRMPMQLDHVKGGEVRWWCVGDAEEIRELLHFVDFLGRKRSNALGRVESWIVEDVAPWGDGFPLVLSDGSPTRPLPPDWPGVRNTARLEHAVLSMPYWDHARAEMAAVPEAW